MPFFVYNLALGDILEVDGDYEVTNVLCDPGGMYFASGLETCITHVRRLFMKLGPLKESTNGHPSLS